MNFHELLAWLKQVVRVDLSASPKKKKNVMSSSLIERECEPLQIDRFSAAWLDTLVSEQYSVIWI